jgi:hypothetical protein
MAVKDLPLNRENGSMREKMPEPEIFVGVVTFGRYAVITDRIGGCQGSAVHREKTDS